jgi:hypothetical protein
MNNGSTLLHLITEKLCPDGAWHNAVATKTDEAFERQKNTGTVAAADQKTPSM